MSRQQRFTGKIEAPLIFDGATGTYLQDKASQEDWGIEELNLKAPDLVLAAHKAYIQAGAGAIKTNTFGANPLRYAKGLALDYLREGARLALSFKEEVQVYGSIGPMETDKKEDYLFVAEALYEAGIRNFLWETFPEASLLLDLLKDFKDRHPDTVHITSFAVFPSGETRLGLLASQVLDQADQSPEVDAMGLNCISGPYHLVKILEDLKTYETPLGLMPNSGYPTMVEDRLVYKENPVYFAETLSQAKGLSYLGGCCGTDPSYIKELIKRVKGGPATREKAPGKDQVKVRTKSHLKAQLEAGKKVMVVEYDPPQEATRDYFDQIGILQKLRVDAVTLADCPIGRPRMDASLTAMILKRDYQLNPLVHMTCRDRNINAIKALLLGLSLEEIQDILLITGDPVPQADREEVKAVFQFNSARLAAFVNNLNQSLENPFTISAALNINARNFDKELEKAKRKIESGVEVFLTQPIMGKDAIENIKEAKKSLHVPILGGIMPLVSYRNAYYLHSQVSGMQVDQEVLDSFDPDMTREEGESRGLNWALKFMEEIEDWVDGFYLITPFQRLYVIERLLEKYGQGEEKQYI